MAAHISSSVFLVGKPKHSIPLPTTTSPLATPRVHLRFPLGIARFRENAFSSAIVPLYGQSRSRMHSVRSSDINPRSRVYLPPRATLCAQRERHAMNLSHKEPRRMMIKTRGARFEMDTHDRFLSLPLFGAVHLWCHESRQEWKESTAKGIPLFDAWTDEGTRHVRVGRWELVWDSWAGVKRQITRDKERRRMALARRDPEASE